MVEIALLLTGLALLAFYFLPTFIAGVRGHHASVGILALNLLLGWTVIFWLAALFWAFGRVRREDEEIWEDGEGDAGEDFAEDEFLEDGQGFQEDEAGNPPSRGRW